MSYVSPLDFFDSLMAAFTTYWADRTPISYPNKPFSPATLVGDDATAAWCRVFLAGDPAGQTQYSNSAATDHFARSGQIVIESYVREQSGSALAYTLADAALLFLQRKDVPDMIFQNISAPQETGSDGTWYQIAVSATWTYFTDRAAL